MFTIWLIPITKAKTAYLFSHHIVTEHIYNAILSNCAFSSLWTLTGSGQFVRSELFHETKPSHCKKSTEVATDLAFGFLTSGNAARHSVKPLETQPSEEFIDLNESDNKL